MFEDLKTEAVAAFDRIIGLELDDVALDGSLHKAPYGGYDSGAVANDFAQQGSTTSTSNGAAPRSPA